MTREGDPAVRIAVWSGPRNLSTALMRSWENRPDTEVMDEPLYAAYLSATGHDHPMRAEILRSQSTDYHSAIETCLAPLDDGILISYQKHMTHHLLAETPLDWLERLTNVILLRDPRRVIASYTKKRADVTLDEIGLPQQVRLVAELGRPLVIDASSFLGDPEKHLRTICERAGVGFDRAMLEWPAGSRQSDGVWAPAWYDAVLASTGFAAPSGPVPLPETDPSHSELVEQAMDLYRDLTRFI